MRLQPKHSPARTSTRAVFGVLRSNTPHLYARAPARAYA